MKALLSLNVLMRIAIVCILAFGWWSLQPPNKVYYVVPMQDGQPVLGSPTTPIMDASDLVETSQGVPIGQDHPELVADHPMYPDPLLYARQAGLSALNTHTFAGHRVIRLSFEETWGQSVFFEVNLPPTGEGIVTTIEFDGEGGYLNPNQQWPHLAKGHKRITREKAEELFAIFKAQQFTHIDTDKNMAVLDGTYATFELLDGDRYHTISLISDIVSRNEILINAVWLIGMNEYYSVEPKTSYGMPNQHWRPMWFDGRFAAISLDNQKKPPEYSDPVRPTWRLVFLDTMEELSGSFAATGYGGILMIPQLNLSLKWYPNTNTIGSLSTLRTEGFTGPIIAWAQQDYRHLELIPNDLRSIEWWINSHQRLQVVQEIK